MFFFSQDFLLITNTHTNDGPEMHWKKKTDTEDFMVYLRKTEFPGE